MVTKKGSKELEEELKTAIVEVIKEFAKKNQDLGMVHIVESLKEAQDLIYRTPISFFL